MGAVDRRNISTAQRLAEYVAELRERGIPVFGATVEGRTIKLDLSGDSMTYTNPADLIDP